MKIDVSGLALDKGDIVDNAMITRLTGTAQKHPHFCFAKLAVAQAIERQLARDQRTASLKIRQDGVHILTDAAAVQHNIRLNRSARRKVNKACKQMAAVNTVMLSDTERAEHASGLQQLINDRRALRDSRDLYALLRQQGQEEAEQTE